MAEFLFKNLSVRLLPGDGDGALAADESVCIASPTNCDVDHTCFELSTGSDGCGDCTLCTVATCGEPNTHQVLLKADPGEMEAELGRYQERLERGVEELQRRREFLRAGAKPLTLAGVDELRAIFVDAVAELDACREKLASEGPTGE